jgi:hypothetical protein
VIAAPYDCLGGINVHIHIHGSVHRIQKIINFLFSWQPGSRGRGENWLCYLSEMKMSMTRVASHFFVYPKWEKRSPEDNPEIISDIWFCIILGNNIDMLDNYGPKIGTQPRRVGPPWSTAGKFHYFLFYFKTSEPRSLTPCLPRLSIHSLLSLSPPVTRYYFPSRKVDVFKWREGAEFLRRKSDGVRRGIAAEFIGRKYDGVRRDICFQL